MRWLVTFRWLLSLGELRSLAEAEIRRGGHGGRRAAAVQAQGCDAAQLRHALGQHAQGRAHADGVLPPVQGVEHHLAVGLHAYGGTGGGGYLEILLGRAVSTRE